MNLECKVLKGGEGLNRWCPWRLSGERRRQRLQMRELGCKCKDVRVVDERAAREVKAEEVVQVFDGLGKYVCVELFASLSSWRSEQVII